MIIGFLGDVHGRVFHAVAVAATWQAATGQKFDLIIQAGDMGAYPDESRMDASTLRYLKSDPSEAVIRPDPREPMVTCFALTTRPTFTTGSRPVGREAGSTEPGVRHPVVKVTTAPREASPFRGRITRSGPLGSRILRSP